MVKIFGGMAGQCHKSTTEKISANFENKLNACTVLQRNCETNGERRMEFNFEQQPGLRSWNQNHVKNAPPLVSIITAYYNGGQYLEQTFQCVIDQTFPFFEWIIVDDGSDRPEDLKLLEKIGAMDPRIRVLHKENGGPASARNYGIRHAKTEYILPVDADDLLEPTFLEYTWWMMERNPDASWAYCSSVGFQGEEYLWQHRFDPQIMKRENLLVVTALFRKKAVLAVGGYQEGERYFNEDWQLFLKMLARGAFPAQSTGEYLFWYRRSNSGALSIAKTDKEIAHRNEQIIEKAAKNVVDPAQPVIYPRQGVCWDSPQMSDWTQCVYANKSKKHILFLFPHLVMGGADKFNFDLIQGLDKDKYDTSILTTVSSDNAWLQRFRSITPNIFNLANFVELKDYAEFISYYIKSRQVDVLFVSNSLHGYYLVPWLREQFPELAIVDYVHMEEWYWHKGGYARTSAVVGAVTEKTYVCNSATRDVMIDHFGRKPESVETVHIGVDADYFKREAVRPGALYKELDISPSRPIVLFICRLHPQKRPFMMLEIAKKVSRCVPDVAFAVVGNGPQEAELREKVEQMGLSKHVYFLGARTEVRPYYRDARVTLVCSLMEGLSLTAYESCAMGVPVVSADVGGQKDLVDDQVGALIPCRQSEADSLDAREFVKEEVATYVQEIVDLLTNDRRWAAAAKMCRERVENGFTIQNMVNYFEAELDRLTTDPAALEQRRQVAQALKLCGPLAAEISTLEMQLQATEDRLNQGNWQGESLMQKVRQVLKQEGLRALFVRALAYMRKRFIHCNR